MHRGIEPIEILVQPQRVEYLAALSDGLAYRSSEATALIAQERKEADGRAAQRKRDIEISGNIQWREDHPQTEYHDHSRPDGLPRGNIQVELRHPEIAGGKNQ